MNATPDLQQHVPLNPLHRQKSNGILSQLERSAHTSWASEQNGQRHISAFSLFQNGRPLGNFFLPNSSHSSRALVALPGETLDGPDEKFRAN